MSRSTRIGILGGTFDPIHLGHLDVAAAGGDALDLSEVVFVPSRVSPHRPSPPAVSGYHRFAMVALAVTALRTFRASDLELGTEGPSYTSVTLEALARHGARPSQLFFITGADAFAEIATWYDYPNVLNRSHFVVVSRPGHQASELPRRLPDIAPRMREPQDHASRDRSAAGTSVWLVNAATKDVSSSEIRERLTNGRSVDGLVPPSVATYIERHRLYRTDRTDGGLHE